MMQEYNPIIARRIEWKTNEGGEVKAQDVVALSWLALNLIEPVRDENNPDRYVEPGFSLQTVQRQRCLLKTV